MADEVAAQPAAPKELYALIDFLCSLGGAVAQIKAEGGKLGFADISLFMGLIPQLSPAFSNISAVPGEVEALAKADQEALVAYIGRKLSIVDAHAQDVLKAALAVGSSAYGLYKAVQSPKVVGA